MGQYTKKGLYNAYKKNNKERAELDFYSTPTQEVTNILNKMQLKFDNQKILEPCAGAGHMLLGIKNYITQNNIQNVEIIATDVKNRGIIPQLNDTFIMSGDEYDFLSDNYPFDVNSVDYIIMNPPFSTIEPFTIRALEIARQGILMLGRLQFLEARGRYDNIFKDYPPTQVYCYIDRIKCYKNGDLTNTGSSAQAYAWFYWDLMNHSKITIFDWIDRIG